MNRELLDKLDIDIENIQDYYVRLITKTSSQDPMKIYTDNGNINDWIGWKFKNNLSRKKEIVLLKDYDQTDIWKYIGTYKLIEKDNINSIHDDVAYDVQLLEEGKKYKDNLEIQYKNNAQQSYRYLEHIIGELEIYEGIKISNLIVNDHYTNGELFRLFNNFISGIRYNSNENIIGVITSEDSLYGDEWDENGVLMYTGEGQIGDQSPTSSGNKALLSANQNKTKIYLFDKVSTNKYYYRGEVYISSAIKTEKEYDKKGNLRTVIKFPLKLVDENTELLYTEEDHEIIQKEKEKKIKELSLEELHNLARNKKRQVVKKIVEVNYAERDPIISKYTKSRAHGKCDLCEQNAPFETKDGPYLECHHVITIAEGGPDVIYNTVALCPNCHRKIHSLKDPKDLKKLSEVIYNYLLSDDDKENMKKWESLFK